MDALGVYQEMDGLHRLRAGLILVAVLAIVALLERAQYVLRETETTAWWASNGRDVLNGLAFCACLYGLRHAGLRGPVVMVIAASFLVALSLVQSQLERVPGRAGVLSVLVSMALVAPVLIAPEAVHRAFVQGVQVLFATTLQGF